MLCSLSLHLGLRLSEDFVLFSACPTQLRMSARSATIQELSDNEVGEDTSSVIERTHEEAVCCYLCLRPKNVTKLFRGVMIHQQCLAAVRCHNRLLASSPAKLDEANQNMMMNPCAWREVIMPLIENDNQNRDKTYMNKLKRKYEEEIKESYALEEVEELEDLVDLDDYIERLKEQGSTLSDETLEDDFHYALSNQHMDGKKHKTKAGVFMLAVGKAKVQLRTVTGGGDRKLSRIANEQEDASESGGRARSLVPSSSGRSVSTPLRHSAIAPAANLFPGRNLSKFPTASQSTRGGTVASNVRAQQEITNPPARPHIIICYFGGGGGGGGSMWIPAENVPMHQNHYFLYGVGWFNRDSCRK